MRSRSIILAISVAFGSNASAAPPKSAPAQAVQSHQAAHVLVLASADAVEAAVPQPGRAAPVQPRQRVARVTHCRCGDPQPDEVSDDSSER